MSDAKPETNNLPKTLQDVTESIFEPNEFGKLEELVSHLGTLTTPIYNGNWAESEEFPSTHRIIVMPIGKSEEVEGEKKHVTKHVVIAAVPRLDAVMHHHDEEKNPVGREYIDRALLAAQKSKIRNSLTREDDITKVTLPFSIDEFIERAQRGAADQGLKSYVEVSSKLVAALAKRKIDVNKVILRQILSNTRMAEALYPKVPQKFWQSVIQTGKHLATEAKLPVDVFDNWLNTRDNAANEVEIGENAEFSLA